MVVNSDQPASHHNEIRAHYDAIATWWHRYHQHGQYGVAAIERALELCGVNAETALDLGCGSGGRIIACLERRGCQITGVDFSSNMLALARQQHPQQRFIHANIANFEPESQADIIVAWDSLFHLNPDQQRDFFRRLPTWLSPGGMAVMSVGDPAGEHTSQWQGRTFYYASLGLPCYADLIENQGLHLKSAFQDQQDNTHWVLVVGRCMSLRGLT